MARAPCQRRRDTRCNALTYVCNLHRVCNKRRVSSVVLRKKSRLPRGDYTRSATGPVTIRDRLAETARFPRVGIFMFWIWWLIQYLGGASASDGARLLHRVSPSPATRAVVRRFQVGEPRLLPRGRRFFIRPGPEPWGVTSGQWIGPLRRGGIIPCPLPINHRSRTSSNANCPLLSDPLAPSLRARCRGIALSAQPMPVRSTA